MKLLEIVQKLREMGPLEEGENRAVVLQDAAVIISNERPKLKVDVIYFDKQIRIDEPLELGSEEEAAKAIRELNTLS